MTRSGRAPLHVRRTGLLTSHHSLFETTIRHVGGLLSAYELSGYQYDILVDKAEEVAQQMAYAFSWVGNFR
jgi:hypothetical protein